LPRYLGIADDELYGHVASAATHGFRHTVVSYSFRRWETAVACIPFTIEGQGGRMHRLMWEGFQRHFDFPSEVMAYWRVHDELEEGHGDVARSLLAPACETGEQQWAVRDAVTATCLTYRAMWDQFEMLVR
jgi:pyrroloquinoline quinone (PQQ) biosynthesis protein C